MHKAADSRTSDFIEGEKNFAQVVNILSLAGSYLYFFNHLEHSEYVKQPWESKEEDLIQTQISDKDNEGKVSSIISTSATVVGKQRNSH